jgi:prepilin-type N-terminal cleavage/methylation domain-containing protein
MMRTSGSCQASDAGDRRVAAQCGFTLLELLIVLALTSMVVALVAPRLSQTVAAIGRSGDRAEVVRQLEELPMQARRQAAAITLNEHADLSALLALPEGWSVVALSPVRVRENGICDAADVQVRAEGLVERWHLQMPDCAVGDAN